MSDTYSQQAVSGGGVTRYDSTESVNASVTFSSTATPTNIEPGEMVYNKTTGALRLNVGTKGTPIWRTVTNS